MFAWSVSCQSVRQLKENLEYCQSVIIHSAYHALGIGAELQILAYILLRL